jgi:hypothetical protein
VLLLLAPAFVSGLCFEGSLLFKCSPALFFAQLSSFLGELLTVPVSRDV